MPRTEEHESYDRVMRWALSIGLGLLLLVGYAEANAQEPDSVLVVRADSILRVADSVLDATKRVQTIADVDLVAPYEAKHAGEAYAGLVSAGLVLNWFVRIDRDPCASGKRVCFTATYKDEWFSPDKFGHFNAAYFLTNGAIEWRVRPLVAAGITCGLAGVGFEVTQGAISPRDIAWDCAGAASAVLMHHLTEKASDYLLRARRRR